MVAKAGQVMTHAVSGSQVKFLKTADDTNGDYIEVEQIIKEGSGLPSHIHVLQTETFRVISGAAKYRINNEERILHAGEEVSFSPGVPHVNPIPLGKEDLHLNVRVSPALDFHVLFETIIQAPEKGDANTDGKLKPLHQAVLFNGLKSKVYLSDQPIWLQKAILPVMAFFGRLAGYKCGYSESGVEKNIS